MSVCVERIYSSKKDIEEYQKSTAELEELKPIEDLLELPLQVSETEEKRYRKLEAFRRAFGLLVDLTTEEWQRFDEAIRRRPLFEKRLE